MFNPSNLVLSAADISPFVEVVATAVVVAFVPGSPLSPFGRTKLNFAAEVVPALVTEAVVPLVTVPTVIVAAFPGSPLSPLSNVGLPSIASQWDRPAPHPVSLLQYLSFI